MIPVRSSEWLWKEGGGYYRESASDLVRKPILPDLRRLRDRRLYRLFQHHGNLARGSRVLEIGCGRSPWLPCLAMRLGCSVFGIDIEPHAAELARANLAGAGVPGEILCRDGFALETADELRGRFDLVYSMGVVEHFDDASHRLSVLARYLRPGGRILTTVPNLQGVNWLLQRLADLKTLQIHVVYDARRLRKVHEAAGFETIASGYSGFYEGFLSSAAGSASRLRWRIHHHLCRLSSLGSEAWLRLTGETIAPEMRWTSPHVFYIGRRPLVHP